MPFDKVRIRFRKSGDLRLVSHLDLMRALERMLRRAALPLRMTEGFHPTPRLVIAQSLSLGLVGLREVMELELTELIEPDEVLCRARAHAPPGIDFLTAQRIPLPTTARPVRGLYRLHFDVPPTDFAARVAQFNIATEVWAERARPKPRQVNIRPYVEALSIEGRALLAAVWITQNGSARAEEIAHAVGIVEPILIERVELELLDELPPDKAARVPTIEPHTRPLLRTTTIVARSHAPRETWGATANGPIVE